MEGVVENHSVELDQILDGRAAADVQLTALVARGYHPGHDLKGPHQVGFAANRKRDDGLGVELDDRRGNLGLLFLLAGVDGDVVEFDGRFLEGDAVEGVFVGDHLDVEGLAAVAGSRNA